MRTSGIPAATAGTPESLYIDQNDPDTGKNTRRHSLIAGGHGRIMKKLRIYA